MREDLTVILGAGASTGSVEPGKTSQNPVIPPITKDLFSTRYEGILDKYGDVLASMGSISHDLEDGKSLEDYIKDRLGTYGHYASLKNHRRRSLNQLPLYLQHLFSHISKSLGLKTHYHRFVHDLFDKDINTTFLSLNYDLLIDRALEKAENNKFTGFGNYTNQQQRWVLIKLHGSVNWFRHITRFSYPGMERKLDNWKVIVRNMNLLKDLSKDIVFLNLDSQFEDGFNGKIPCYPVLAIPNTEYSPIFPIDEQRQLLEKRLHGCENFLFIGFSAWDEDVLNILNQNVNKVRNLLIIGKSDAEGIYERLVKKAPMFKTNNLEEVLYDKGFETFMRGGIDINNFLDKIT